MKSIGPEYECMCMCVYIGMLVCVSVYMYVHVLACWEGVTRKKSKYKTENPKNDLKGTTFIHPSMYPGWVAM